MSINHKLLLYFSPLPEERAEGVDALSENWENLDLYTFPPTKFLVLVLRKAREESCLILLIAPAWPNQVWFPALLDLVISPPIQLPWSATLLRQPGNPPLFDKKVEMRYLHAWEVDVRISSNKGSHSRWLAEYRLLRENSPESCRSAVSLSFSHGQRTMQWMKTLSLYLK